MNDGKKFHKVNRRFEASEDEKLKMLVSKYGNDWGLISNEMPGRNKRQCKDRWEQYLSPNAKVEPWTSEEEALLLKLVEENGHNWKIIAQSFPGRALPQVRNKYRTLSQRSTETCVTQELKSSTNEANEPLVFTEKDVPDEITFISDENFYVAKHGHYHPGMLC